MAPPVSDPMEETFQCVRSSKSDKVLSLQQKEAYSKPSFVAYSTGIERVNNSLLSNFGKL